MMTNNRFLKPKISMEECRSILNINGNYYTDEQIVKIYDFVCILAEIDFNHFTNEMKKRPVVPLIPSIEDDIKKAS